MIYKGTGAMRNHGLTSEHVSPLYGEWTDFGVVISLITEHLNMRPSMQVQDVYKLIYQGIMGSEHILGAEKNGRGRFAIRATTALGI